MLWTWDVVACCVLLNIYYRVLNHESVSKKRQLYAFVISSHLCVFYCLLFFWQMDPAWLFGLFLHILDDKSNWCRVQVNFLNVFWLKIFPPNPNEFLLLLMSKEGITIFKSQEVGRPSQRPEKNGIWKKNPLTYFWRLKG